MAQKDLIIGAFSNYNDYNVLKPWVQSIKDTGFSGDIVLIAIDVGHDITNTLKQNGVIVIRDNNEQGERIHMLRFLHIYNYIKNNPNVYRYVITTDVRDVVFQLNPSEYLDKEENFPHEKDLLIQSEAILIKDEKWNRENIIKNFGLYFYNDVKDSPVYNVGILAGEPDWVRDACFSIYQLSLNRPDWVADQAAFNVMVNYRPWINHIHHADLSSAWAINAHVTNKPDQMEEFGPYLLEQRPSMVDGIVQNSQGIPFVIVHQYDRVPEWTEHFSNKYQTNVSKRLENNNSAKYFTYKTT